MLTKSPGVLWFGLPTAIVTAVWNQFRDEGYSWHALWDIGFAIRLGVAVYFIGYCGGRSFNWTMRRFGFDFESPIR